MESLSLLPPPRHRRDTALRRAGHPRDTKISTRRRARGIHGRQLRRGQRSSTFRAQLAASTRSRGITPTPTLLLSSASEQCCRSASVSVRDEGGGAGACTSFWSSAARARQGCSSAAKAGVSQPFAVIRRRAQFSGSRYFMRMVPTTAAGRCASRGLANEGFSMVAPGEASRGGRSRTFFWSGTARVGGYELVTLLSHFCRAGPFPRRFDRWKRGLSRTLLRSHCANRFFCCAVGVLVARHATTRSLAASSSTLVRGGRYSCRAELIGEFPVRSLYLRMTRRSFSGREAPAIALGSRTVRYGKSRAPWHKP